MGGSSRKKHSPNPRASRLPGQQAMSAALIGLAEPLRRDDMTLLLSSLAWNIAQFPKEEQKKHARFFQRSIEPIPR